jgi:hypothetical protein
MTESANALATAGDGRDQGNDGTGRKSRVESLEEADVFVGHKDVDESTDFTGVVEHAGGQTGVEGLHGGNGISHVGGLDLNFGRSSDEYSELTG